MNPIKRSLRAFVLLVGSYALLSLIYVLPVDVLLVQWRTTVIFYLIPSVGFFVYFTTRIIDRRVRWNLAAVGALIVLWSVLQAAKYIAFEESESIDRLIWYLFYIPMLTIPQFSFQAAVSVGRPEERKLPWIRYVTGAFTLFCIVVVLTNDLNQQVFEFAPGFANWDADYLHKPLFWVITIWTWLFFFFSTSILFHKCRLSASRKLTWIPVLYLGIGIVGLYVLNIGRLPQLWGRNIGEFSVMACYTLGGFWVLCITIGLVPSNKGYGKLLSESGLAVSIADAHRTVVYRSPSAKPFSDEQFAEKDSFFVDENTKVYRRPVTGGNAFWQVDISEMNEINRELEEMKEKIAEENELIRAANELKARRAQIDAKSRVYDKIAVQVLPQSRKIVQLSEEAKTYPERFEENMRLISVYAVYIKRISNMMLLSSEGPMSKHELALALSESARYLNKAGIAAEVSGELYKADNDSSKNSDDVTTKMKQGKKAYKEENECLIRLYERFEILLEEALPTLKALQIVVAENVLKMTFEGAVLTLPDQWEGSVEADEDTTFIRLILRGEVRE